MSALPMLRQFSTAIVAFPSPKCLDRCDSTAAFETKVSEVSQIAPPNDPNMGRYSTGCGVGMDALAAPITLQAMQPPLPVISGFTPQTAGLPSARPARFPGSGDPPAAPLPCLI